jgi:SAM-dependent methyltransferase
MTRPALYAELAPWFHLLTPPAEYADEAAFVLEHLREHVDGPLETLLELGSGGGNTASHLSRDLTLTLTDLSPEMLELSRTINPGIEHVVGDMRELRLGRTFDAVLIHDAVCYMTTESDLRAAMETAFAHLRPGGAAVFMPDHVRETFKPETDHGGEDEASPSDGRPGRAMRYLEWTTDPDPADTTYQVDYAVLLREADGRVDVRHDRHTEGLFPRQTWLDLLAQVGFEGSSVVDRWERLVFIGRRPVSP